jgi:hypothetical protein
MVGHRRHLPFTLTAPRARGNYLARNQTCVATRAEGIVGVRGDPIRRARRSAPIRSDVRGGARAAIRVDPIRRAPRIAP